MKSIRRQRGVSGALVAVILVLVIAGILGTRVVTGMLAGGRTDAKVQAQFEAAMRALTQYATTAQRLPCPANPAADTGEEVLPGPNAATCSFPEGTLPWKTIGLAREAAIDPWGQKISYRVYTGANGSLTQPGGASMIQCDTVEPSPSGTTALDAGGAGGLCQQQPQITLRSTPPGSYAAAGFLQGKGLTVSDMGSARTGVAFVLVSHGATGRGGYTTSGTRREMPVAGSDERRNTGTDPFVIKAASKPGTDPATAEHFDDLLSYRTIEDLIKAAGLHARDWPEETLTFDRPTVEAAVGTSVTPGAGVGEVTVSFVGVVASGLTTGGTATEISFDEVGGVGGLGVAGGGSAFLQSSANERLRLAVAVKGEKFGATLNHFGYYSGDVFEIVEFQFYLEGVAVGVPKYAIGCNVDGGLASFDIDVGGTFDRVDITPYPAYDLSANSLSGITALLVTQIRACPASASDCRTPLWTAANDCPYIE